MRRRINVDLMYRVADYIEAHPYDYDQTEWCDCIGGTAVRLQYDLNREMRSTLAHRMPEWGFGTLLEMMAARCLGLTAAQARRVFGWGDGWPEPYNSRYHYAQRAMMFGMPSPNRIGMAKAAADMLRYMADQAVMTQAPVKSEELVKA